MGLVPERMRCMKIKPSKTLEELSKDYFKTEFSERAPNTVRNHTFYLNEFVQFICKRKIDPYSYQDWTKYAFRKWSPQTAKCLALAASSRFLNWMVMMGHMDQSPHKVTKAPLVKQAPPREPFTSEEVEKLKSVAKSENQSLYWAIVCGWETGMAIGDVCMLTWAEVDFAEHIIVIYRLKTKERCIIPFREGGECEAILQEKFTKQSIEYPNRPQDGILYVDSNLAYLYKRGSGSVSLLFSAIRKKAGVDLFKSFHNLRASYCSRLANAGIQTTLACQMTGHKNPEIFKHYVTPDIVRIHEQSKIAWEKQA